MIQLLLILVIQVIEIVIKCDRNKIDIVIQIIEIYIVIQVIKNVQNVIEIGYRKCVTNEIYIVRFF